MALIDRLHVDNDGCHGAEILNSTPYLHAIYSRYFGAELSFGMIKFSGTIAYKYATEPAAYELAEYPDAYDALIEIPVSDWSKKYRKSRLVQSSTGLKTYGVYFSNAGFLTVLATKAEHFANFKTSDLRTLLLQSLEY